LIFDSNIGDVLSIRIAGNVVSPEIIGSIELACQEIQTKLIVVMGHSNCGAVASAISKLRDHNIGAITDKIQPAVLSLANTHSSSDKMLQRQVAMQNVKNSVSEIIDQSEYLADMIKQEKVGIVAAYYDTETGEVSFSPHRALADILGNVELLRA
jgi:carbonic anhydrase/SulP family sulfate permease